MKSTIIYLIVIVITILSLGSFFMYNQKKMPITPAINTINIQNFAFDPSILTVKKGSTVTWINNDSAPHIIKSDTFNSSTLSKGQSYSFTFNTIGSFNYICTIHPTMTGKIIVE